MAATGKAGTLKLTETRNELATVQLEVRGMSDLVRDAEEISTRGPFRPQGVVAADCRPSRGHRAGGAYGPGAGGRPMSRAGHDPAMLPLSKAAAALWLLDQLHAGELWDRRDETLTLNDLTLKASDVRDWLESVCIDTIADALIKADAEHSRFAPRRATP